MPSTPARVPDARSTDPTNPSFESTKVIVWRAEEGSRSDLDPLLQRWKNREGRVRRCEPRVLEGPTYGVFLVLEREPHVEERLRRRPIRRDVDLEKSRVVEKDARS